MCVCGVMLEVGAWRCEMGHGTWDMGHERWEVWQGSRVRFPAREVKFDFLFILLLPFGFLAGICFGSVLFCSLFFCSHASYFSIFIFSFSLVSSFHLFIFSSFHIFIFSSFHVFMFSYFQNLSALYSVGCFRTMFHRTAGCIK
jgi:hypothetical protein